MVQPLFNRDVGSEPERPAAQSINIGQDKVLTNEPAGARLTERRADQVNIKAHDAPAYRLPKQYAVDFLDRRREMTVAGRALEGGQSIELFGPPGIGKSFLLHFMTSHIPKTIFPDGVFSLAAYRQPAEDLRQALFDAFYETTPPTILDSEIMRRQLQNKQALVLLDDVTASEDGLQTLLDLAPDTTFFMASTQSRPWTNWQTMVVSELPQADAIRLVERAFERELADDEEEDAQAIIDLLGGHPLHILQVVSFARVRDHSLAEVARQLQEASPDQAMTDMLIEELTPRERDLVGVLAALGGVALSREHLVELVGLPNFETASQSLNEQHLIEIDGDHYKLLGMLPETLRQTFDLTTWSEQSLTYFTNWAATHQQRPADLLAEADVMLRALEWAVANERWEPILELARPLENALLLGKRWGAWEQVLRWTLQAARANDDQPNESWALHQLGTRALCLNDIKTARNHLETALSIRENLNNQIWIEVTRHNLSFIGDPPMPPSLPPPPPPRQPYYSSGSQPPFRPTSSSGGRRTIPAWLQGLAVILPLLLLIFAVIYFFSREGAADNLLEPFQALVSNPTATLEPGERMTFIQVVPDHLNLQPNTTQDVIVTNTGSEPLFITGINLAGRDPTAFQASLAANDATCAQGEIAPTKSCTIKVSMLSDMPGERSAELSITSNGDINPYRIALNAGQNPTLNMSVAALNLGSQLVNAEGIPQPVTLSNNGNTDVTIDSVTVSGASQNQFDFVADSCSRTTLRPGESCTLNVAFTPNGTGSRAGDMIVSLNGGLTQYRLPLSGAGVAATPTSTPIPSPTVPLTPTPTRTAQSGTPTPTSTRVPLAVVSPAQINFGAQPVNTGSSVQNVTVQNTGSAQLIINGVFLGGLNTSDFSRSGGTCGSLLDPSQTCTIGLVFRPIAQGSRTASLTINHNAAGSPAVVNLSGSGSNPNATLCLSTDQLTFAPQQVNTTGPELTATLTNCGTVPLLIQNITISGDSADFVESINRQCRNMTISVNSTCIIGYQFRPTQVGSRLAILTIVNNGEDGDQEIELNGVGTN